MPTATGRARVRLRVDVQGLVQGVGFRPFVHALAHDLALSGSVVNTPEGVRADIEGDDASTEEFVARVRHDAPVLAVVQDVATARLPLRGGSGFTIDDTAPGRGRTCVSPDVATCADCLSDLTDPTDRRYRHPFVSCTSCGPRFTIVTALPYDRPTTTMAGFPLCDDCAREYADPTDRRFHAQPVCCPACGPVLRLRRPDVDDVGGDAAVAQTRQLLAAGAIVAVKGVGGYHLACDAADERAVARLRHRKRRGNKPFAVMVSGPDLAATLAHLGTAARDLLVSPQRPVVLLPRDPARDDRLAASVAPGSPDLGIMLAYTPLHHLLLGLPGDPPGPTALVMTSGNLAGEPIVTEDDDAEVRLAELVDAWLQHDRPIHVPCDDSVVRAVEVPARVARSDPRAPTALPVRRSRGYAPMPLSLPRTTPAVLAVGADVKNTFCLAEGRQAWLSAHVGDMDDLRTLEAFEHAAHHLEDLTGIRPTGLVADRHPGYRSGRWARGHAGDRPLTLVQHHHAHVAATMAEHGHPGDRHVLGVAFDGTGYGDDGAVWGGEFLLADYAGFARLGHLAYVPLPGGDAGVRNPCRMALSHLRAAGLPWSSSLPSVEACSDTERTVLARQLDTGFSCVPTSSMGRLFDAVASLTGTCHRAGYDAQAAVELEGRARLAGAGTGGYRFPPAGQGGAVDAGPVLGEIVADLAAGRDPDIVAARFHAAVAGLVLDTALSVRATTGTDEVTLSGGVFLNVLLTRLCAEALVREGFRVLRHRRVPPSDAGIALGQVAVHAQQQDPHRHHHQQGQDQTARPSETELSCV